jgi:hypothetical protein
MLVPTLAFAWWLVAFPARVVGPASGPRETIVQGKAEGELQATKRVMVRSALSPEMVHTAQTFLDLPMGTERTALLDGRRYVFVLEWHYHAPGFVGAPTGWHKGVTIYEEQTTAL